MSAPPYMQLYVADYLGDTRHLTTEQHGAYLLLLMAMWRAGGSLPNDQRKLARMTGLTAARWGKIASDVVAFFDVANGVMTHRRVQKELEKASQTSDHRRESGARGGLAKSLKTNKADVASATVLPEQIASKPLAYQTSEPLQDAKASCKRASDEFEEWYSGYPHKVGRAAARKSYPTARRKASQAELVAGRDRYVAEKPADHPWCNPATWLNQERWLDQPQAVVIQISTRGQGPPSLGDRIAAERQETQRILEKIIAEKHG